MALLGTTMLTVCLAPAMVMGFVPVQDEAAFVQVAVKIPPESLDDSLRFGEDVGEDTTEGEGEDEDADATIPHCCHQVSCCRTAKGWAEEKFGKCMGAGLKHCKAK